MKITGADNDTIFYENDPINLSCSLRNGNPLAKLMFSCWSLTGNNTSTSTAAVSVLSSIAKKSYNQKTCKCSAEHILLPKTLEYVLQTTVYCKFRLIHRILSFKPNTETLISNHNRKFSSNGAV